jgi:hypothetical protein
MDHGADETSQTFGFRELLALVHRAANLFLAVGLPRGGVVSTLLPNLPQTHADGGNREFREFAMSCDVRARESSVSCSLTRGPVIAPCQTDDAPFEDPFGETSRTPVSPRHDRLDIAMLRIERSADGEDVCFTVTGRVEAVHVAELQRLIDEERAAHRPVALDLKEVKLVDREAVSFFVRCKATGVGLENCPAYVREWISHEIDETRDDEIPCGERPKMPKK